MLGRPLGSSQRIVVSRSPSVPALIARNHAIREPDRSPTSWERQRILPSHSSKLSRLPRARSRDVRTEKFADRVTAPACCLAAPELAGKDLKPPLPAVGDEEGPRLPDLLPPVVDAH